MKTYPTAISVTLIIMGTLLIALPTIHNMVTVAQEAYVLAHSPTRNLIRRELGDFAQFSLLALGIAMVVLAIRNAARTAPGQR